MDFNIPIELEIRLKINDFDDKDIGDKIFKPKHVDEKLGDKIYLTDKYELLPENLEKAGFKNDEGEHRSLLSSKTKMRNFLVSMQTGDRDAKGARYAKESIKEQDKKIEENKKKMEEADEDKKAELESIEETLTNEKERLEKKRDEFENKSPENKTASEIIKTNLNFVLKAFFKKKTNIKISPNNFIIYSSGIGEGTLENKERSDKSSKKSDLIKKFTTFNIKIFEEKDKVGRLDLAKVGCKERAERIEKDVFELLGISVDLFKNSTVYNPVNIFNKLREDSTKKDANRDARVRIFETEMREKKANKEARKIVRDKLKKEKRKKRERRNNGTIDDDDVDDVDDVDDGNSDSDDSDDDDVYDRPDRDKKINKLLNKEKKKEKKDRKEKKEKKEKEKKEENDEKRGDDPQKGGYKYSKTKSRKTRRKRTAINRRKTRRKY